MDITPVRAMEKGRGEDFLEQIAQKPSETILGPLAKIFAQQQEAKIANEGVDPATHRALNVSVGAFINF